MIYSQLSALPEMAQLASLKQSQQNGQNTELSKVARQFESIFTHMMIKSMRQASLGNELFNGNGYETYRDMFDQQIAQAMSQGKGLGIAEAMLRQLQPPQATSLEAITSGQTAKAATAPEWARVKAPPVSIALDKPLINPAAQLDKANEAISAASSRRQEVLRLDGQNINSRPDSPEAFIAKVWPAAKRVANELGVSPRVLVAQAALETGWGRHMPKHADGSSSENYFGIKTHNQWQGKQVTASTQEFINGQTIEQQAEFRAYQSIEASFADFANFLKTNPRYQEALSVSHDSEKFVDALQEAGYATDPSYADKLKSIMNGHRMNLVVAQVAVDDAQETTA
ncbi:MAG: flagellar assembly peptidoglycan hydrolase FlgJ [Salinisphaeraceae bacterium]|nr:flagellar assembly peptidoglycan hydrolase FlgJ [Salinisphaeraceae bacterium]